MVGIRLLLEDENLLRLSVWPAALTLLVTLGFLWGGIHWGQPVLARVWPEPVACLDCSWYREIWTGVEVVLWHAAWLLGAVLAAGVAGLATSRLALTLAMGWLAKAALERLGISPAGSDVTGSTGRQIARSLALLVLFLAGQGCLLLLSLLPGAGTFTAPAAFVWSCAWLFVDTCSYPLQWLGPVTLGRLGTVAGLRPALTLGFALSTCLLLMVPLAGAVATPVAVIAACAYVAEVRLSSANLEVQVAA